jgi:glycosyltransferase involved in cell wall biosynthesis
LAGKTKMLEAGACQMAVLTSETGALGHPKDLFLEAKSKNDYLQKLQYLQDEKARTTIGKKLRLDISEKYNVDVETKKLLKLYEELSK